MRSCASSLTKNIPAHPGVIGRRKAPWTGDTTNQALASLKEKPMKRGQLVKYQLLRLALAVPLLLLCAWPRASVAQVAIAYAVVAWGNNDDGQTTAPFAAQSGLVAIAAGQGHTVALQNDGSVVAWGNNKAGQTTIPLAAQSGVTAIAAGS